MMLSGIEPLAKGQELGDARQSDLLRGCDYRITKMEGSEQLNITGFDVGKAFSKSCVARGQPQAFAPDPEGQPAHCISTTG
jgi:hypothetical protein